MEDSDEVVNVVPELYFLIAKFLSGGPLKETAKTLLKELQSVEVLPRRLDWEGNHHSLTYNELESQYSEISWERLASVCERALHIARKPEQPLSNTADLQILSQQQKQISARLSLLSESLVRPKPKYASFKQDHTLIRRLVSRELGAGGGSAASGGAGVSGNHARAPRPFPARLLKGLTLQRRTLGHLSAVYCLAFDRTGRYVLTGADDLLVKVWSAIDGRLAATLRGAGAEITDVCASYDGALLACGSVERLVRVWCLATGAPKAVLHAHGGTITSVQWSPGAHGELRWLASTSTDGSVAFWTCSREGQFLSQPVQYVERLRPGACHMICAAWSAGGAFLAAGSADQRVRVYALEASGPRRVLETAAHSDAVDSLAWAHRGLRFVSGSKDGTAALWTLHATQWRHVVLRVAPNGDTGTEDAGRKLKVTMVCWDRSDAYVLTAVSDSSVRVWCAKRAVQVRVLAGHRDEAYVLEAHPILPGVVLSAGHDGQLFIWSAEQEEPLARFHNVIAGQGEGALFDARWGACGARVAASDSHGHLLLLGLGAGHSRLSKLPLELFFHTDYRPLARDALGGALDEQTDLPPHLMPPPFLVDVEGAPHPPEFQRLVPGREALPLEQLVPRTRLDAMIEALAADPLTPQGEGGAGAGAGGHGVWRGEGVRHTAGSWQGLDVPLSTRPIVPPLPYYAREEVERASTEMNTFEMSWYKREMRRRPVMISTAVEGPRRRPGRHPKAAPRARPAPPRQAPAMRIEDEVPDILDESGSDTSDESVRLSGSRSSRSSRTSRSSSRSHSSKSSRGRHSSADMSDSDSSHSASKSDSSASSQYSDWEAGAALAPPARARRRPVPTTRYSPSTSTTKRTTAGPSTSTASVEVPELYRVGEWLTAVLPRKAPYHPQMGDHCLYFRVGHQRYFEAVAEKDLYKIHPRDKPWERMQICDCESVKVVGVKYVIKPPRVVSLKLARARDGRSFTVRYHDMPDVIDFLVLAHHYEAAVARCWGAGDRFRCMIDDSWWTGQVLERSQPAHGSQDSDVTASDAASHFLSLRVRWDNGEVERLSPWDLEPIDPERLPSEPGGAVAVLPHELEAVLARSHEWPPQACRTVAQHISQVMSLSVAEPFVAPVDLQLYPSYALIVPYPIDLATIRARFENLFYRRAAAAQFDARWLASNAERFNEPHSPIVRQARLVTDLLLAIISNWEEVDVVAKYHELTASYHSSDDDVTTDKKRRPNRPRTNARQKQNGGTYNDTEDAEPWQTSCATLLRELCASSDAEPFRQPVCPAQAPDYLAIVTNPMDLGTVQQKLLDGQYSHASQLAADVRLVFANSRLYNTNKRSRIYSMTVRLSSLFEALWARMPVEARSTRCSTRRAPRRERARARARERERARERDRERDRVRARAGRVRPHRRAREPRVASPTPAPTASMSGTQRDSSCSSSEPLAETSRRVHALRPSPSPSPPPAASPPARAPRPAARGGRGDDSWDSDVPLTSHRKGKGVGKKSKSAASASSSSRPAPESYTLTSNGVPSDSDEETNRRPPDDSGSDSSAYSRIEVVEEELAEDEVELEYEPSPSSQRHRTKNGPQRGARPVGSNRKRKRRRLRSSASSGASKPHKRTRERFTDASWSSSSNSGSRSGWGSADAPRRYESDRSYRPYSSDEDAPLLTYRQRQGEDEEAGPSRVTHSSHRSAGVSLRRRGSPRRYNEDSEEDSVAAISKRLPHHHHHHQQQQQALARRRHHAQGSANVGVLPSNAANAANAATNDHNYFNGHMPRHNGAGMSSGSGGSGPVSISSRGRVRKLTAKARGLLRP